jgi:hypothetical protein
MFEKQNEMKADPTNRATFFNQLHKFSDEFIELSKKAVDSLTSDERKALIELSKDDSIVFTI